MMVMATMVATMTTNNNDNDDNDKTTTTKAAMTAAAKAASDELNAFEGAELRDSGTFTRPDPALPGVWESGRPTPFRPLWFVPRCLRVCNEPQFYGMLRPPSITDSLFRITKLCRPTVG